MSFLIWLQLVTSVALAVPPPPWQGEKSNIFLHSDYILEEDSTNNTFFSSNTQFKYIYLRSDGSCHDQEESETIEIMASMGISDHEMRVGCETVGKTVKGMMQSVFHTLTWKATIGFFTWDDKVSIFPQNSRLRDTPECRGRCDGDCRPTCTGDGRKWDETAGSGSGALLTCVVDNFMCYPNDGYQRKYSVLVHEFGHTVHFNLPSHLRKKVTEAYDNAWRSRTWNIGSYAMRNLYEYFATATAAYFNVDKLGTRSSGGMTSCDKPKGSSCDSESDARAYMAKKDPELYSIMEAVYGHDQSGMTMCPN